VGALLGRGERRIGGAGHHPDRARHYGQDVARADADVRRCLLPHRGGGHTWPGSQPVLPHILFGRTSQTIDATRVIWDFFAAHVR
jgi:polyhydroxybutyrate depolymerase